MCNRSAAFGSSRARSLVPAPAGCSPHTECAVLIAALSGGKRRSPAEVRLSDERGLARSSRTPAEGRCPCAPKQCYRAFGATVGVQARPLLRSPSCRHRFGVPGRPRTVGNRSGVRGAGKTVWFMERSQQEERVARNQSLFRAINGRVEALNETFVQLTPYGNWITPYGSWICECADTKCQQRIAMTLGEYEALREPGSLRRLAGWSACCAAGRAGRRAGRSLLGGREDRRRACQRGQAGRPVKSHGVSGGGSRRVMGNGRFELRFRTRRSAATAHAMRAADASR